MTSDARPLAALRQVLADALGQSVRKRLGGIPVSLAEYFALRQDSPPLSDRLFRNGRDNPDNFYTI